MAEGRRPLSSPLFPKRHQGLSHLHVCGCSEKTGDGIHPRISCGMQLSLCSRRWPRHPFPGTADTVRRSRRFPWCISMSSLWDRESPVGDKAEKEIGDSDHRETLFVPRFFDRPVHDDDFLSLVAQKKIRPEFSPPRQRVEHAGSHSNVVGLQVFPDEKIDLFCFTDRLSCLVFSMLSKQPTLTVYPLHRSSLKNNVFQHLPPHRETQNPTRRS